MRLSAEEATAALIARYSAELPEQAATDRVRGRLEPHMANLSRREAGLLIREEVPELGGIVARKLGRLAYAVYAAHDFPVKRSTPAALAALPWVGFDDDHLRMQGQELAAGPSRRPPARDPRQQLAGAARGGPDRRRPRRAALPLLDRSTAAPHRRHHPRRLRRPMALLVIATCVLPRVRAVMDTVIDLFQREQPLLEGRSCRGGASCPQGQDKDPSLRSG